MEKFFFMTATSGADSGNDVDEENRGLGVGLEAPAGFTVGQRIGMKPPTVEYFYVSDNQFACIFAHKVSQRLLVLQLQTPVDVQPCYAVRTHSLLELDLLRTVRFVCFHCYSICCR